MTKNIYTLLDQYVHHTINNFSISTEENQICLQLKGENSQVSIQFDDVLTYLYFDEELQPVSISNGAPISPISYYQNGYGEFIAVETNRTGDTKESRIALPNFLLSMIDASVLIEAKSISIDGIRYGTKDLRH